jgi:aryl-alcohol dehydrogenase-like predicted oxidoreductase
MGGYVAKQRLGNSELQVSRLCFGCNVLGWTADEQRSFELLDALAASEINFLDTANTYQTWVPGHGGGESEAIIGKWLKLSGKRKEVVIATKLGKPMGDGGKGLSRKYMFSEVEASLKRLQTDYIDLYQSHEDDPNTPLEEAMGAFAELVKQGKVRAIGASNFKGARLAEAIEIAKKNGWPAYVSLQPHYNLVYRTEFESDLEPVCAKYGLAVLPYFALASGFLTGKYRSEDDLKNSARGGMVKRYFNERGLGVLHALDEVAKKHGVTQGQIALAWLMARPVQTIPIASATTIAQFEQLVEATRFELDRESVQQLNAASAEAVPSPS